MRIVLKSGIAFNSRTNLAMADKLSVWGGSSPTLTKKPISKKNSAADIFSAAAATKSDEKTRLKKKLYDEALKAECVPSVVRVKRVTLLKKDANAVICLGSDDECDTDSLTKSIASAKISRRDEEPSERAKENSSPVEAVQNENRADSVVTKRDSMPSFACEHTKSPSASPPERPKTTKRSKEYVFVSPNAKIENAIKMCPNLKCLTADQIYYMVLRDVNRLIDIFSGCQKSWRHDEFGKNRLSSRVLSENSALSNFTQDQFTSAYRGLETIFCKKNHKYDDYLMNVLLPEVLIGICAQVYECSRDDAEEFLRITHSKSDLETSFPRGSLKAPRPEPARAKFKIPKKAVSCVLLD